MTQNAHEDLVEEHPIDPVIRKEIEATLARIEAEHAVKVLFACESGSRGWGFASPESDYDVIELPVNEIYDVSGWDLRKALGLLRNGNATLVEWLSSPVIYGADTGFLQAVRAAALEVDRPERAFHHYLHMAKKNYREYLQGEVVRLKKYLYVLRPLLACLWIEQQRGPVPMRFQDMVDALVTDQALGEAIAELLHIKRRASEADLRPPMPVINAFIELHLERLSHASAPEPQEQDFSVLDRLLYDTVMR